MTQAQPQGPWWLTVVLDVPLPGPFDYRSAWPVPVGGRVIVPFGRRDMIGVVVATPAEPALPPAQIRDVLLVLEDIAPLSADWIRLATFAADYYQRPLGEVMLPALPAPLRKPSSYLGKLANGGPVARLDRKAQRAAALARKPRRASAAKKAAENRLDVAIPHPDAGRDTSAPSLADTPLALHPGAPDAPRATAPARPADDALAPGSAATLPPATLPGPDEDHHAPSEAAKALPDGPGPEPARILNPAQQAAVDACMACTGFAPVLLYGVTGSGKTEVYLRLIARTLAAGQQALLMVPEINLTPQLEQVLRARLEAIAGPGQVAVLHSGLAEGARLDAWLRAMRGQARVVLGTRLSIFVPLPALGLIVVDEEHDPSYKQQEGLRYSARDLAIWRARDRNIPVLLGSATPSLESWQHAETGRYLRLALPARAVAAAPPEIRLIDTRGRKLQHGLSEPLVKALGERLAAGEQSLVFLNRRGYAPVLHCQACGWMSDCTRCSAHMVLHRAAGHGHVLRCHHCGDTQRVPRACPDCGNQDLQPMGQGTQRLEERLAELFPEARVGRIDADSTRRKGSAEQLFAQVHAGDIDILIGTQMVAKGHDFRNLGLVGVLNADAMLFSHDFRAPERLFAQLMQVAGRAGRHTGGSQVLIQTGYPEQPVYQALVRHDYDGFARYALTERQATALPPFAHQALLTAEAGELALTLEFLEQARALPIPDGITLYDPVPLRVVRVAQVERAQLLVESPSRPAVQAFLRQWLPAVARLPQARRVRWQLEVDPQEI